MAEIKTQDVYLKVEEEHIKLGTAEVRHEEDGSHTVISFTSMPRGYLDPFGLKESEAPVEEGFLEEQRTDNDVD